MQNNGGYDPETFGSNQDRENGIIRQDADHTDPRATTPASLQDSCVNVDCQSVVDNMRSIGVNVVNKYVWTKGNLDALYTSFVGLANALRQSPEEFRNLTLHVDAFGYIDLYRQPGVGPDGSTATTTLYSGNHVTMTFYDGAFGDPLGGGVTAAHEFGHVWDFRTFDEKGPGALSRDMESYRQKFDDNIFPSNGPHITGSIQETFAESVAAYLVGSKVGGYDPNFPNSSRYDYLKRLIGSKGVSRSADYT